MSSYGFLRTGDLSQLKTKFNPCQLDRKCPKLPLFRLVKISASFLDLFPSSVWEGGEADHWQIICLTGIRPWV